MKTYFGYKCEDGFLLCLDGDAEQQRIYETGTPECIFMARSDDYNKVAQAWNDLRGWGKYHPMDFKSLGRGPILWSRWDRFARWAWTVLNPIGFALYWLWCKIRGQNPY